LTASEFISTEKSGGCVATTSLNKWIVAGNLAADAQVKTVELKTGGTAQIANATLFVRKVSGDRKESFTVYLNIWDKSLAWRSVPFLKKGSLIICTGSIEASPFISNFDNTPKAGLRMTVVDIDLAIVKGLEGGEEPDHDVYEDEDEAA
jgi:single-strand DNA-binding protein